MDLLKYETHKGRKVSIPNSWEQLKQEEYLNLLQLLALHAVGTITRDDVMLHFVAHHLGVDLQKITDPQAMQNLIIIAENVSFIFNKQGQLKALFTKQMFPKFEINHAVFIGYSINSSYGNLTCSLVAKQFIEAQELLNGGDDKLPLLASILYADHPYKSQAAHANAKYFETLPKQTLIAIAFNFQAFVGFIFKHTEYSILMQRHKKAPSKITMGLLDMLYTLSSDGLGDVENIEQMNVLTYLKIMRKKLVEAVKAMDDAKISYTEIMEKTGLDSKIINEILK